MTVGSSDRRKSRRTPELPAVGSPDFGRDYRPYGDHSIPVSSLLDVRSSLLVLFLSSILCSTQSWKVVVVPRAIGKSVPRRLKIVPLFPSRLAAPRHLTRVVVLVFPVAVAVVTRGHRLPLLLRLLPLLLLLLLLGLSRWLMKKRKRWIVPDAPLLFHRFAHRLVVRRGHFSLFHSPMCRRS